MLWSLTWRTAATMRRAVLAGQSGGACCIRRASQAGTRRNLGGQRCHSARMASAGSGPVPQLDRSAFSDTKLVTALRVPKKQCSQALKLVSGCG